MIRRHFKRISMFGLLGIATTVVVSWWLALQTDLRGAPRTPQSSAEFLYESVPHDQVWIFNSHASRGAVEISCAAMGPIHIGQDQNPAQAYRIVQQSDVPSWSVMQRAASGPSNHIEQAFGWPMLALMQRFQGDLQTDQWSRLLSIPAQPAFRGFGPGIGLPLRIIPVGFLVNAIFYAWFWFALLSFPILVRRTLRVRRGSCAHCGYDLRASQGACPECGKSR